MPSKSGLFFRIFLAPFHTLVNIAFALIAFGNGVPVLLGHFNAVLLHKGIDEVVLPLE